MALSSRIPISRRFADRDVLDTAESVNGYVHFRKDAVFEFPRDLNGWLSLKYDTCTIVLHCLQLTDSLTKLARIHGDHCELIIPSLCRLLD